MKSGLLWYDNDARRALADKIGLAARRYHEKYGSWPNTCYVHPQSVANLEEADLQVREPAHIRVVSATNILRHHFWLGERPKSDERTSGGASN
jgi:hypothetical protein